VSTSAATAESLGSHGSHGKAVERARLLYDRLNNDPLSIPDMCHPDVRATLSPDLPFGGSWRGKHGVRTCLEQAVEAISSLQVIPRTFLSDGDRVVVLGFVHFGDDANTVGFAHVVEFGSEKAPLLHRFSDRTNPHRLLAGMTRQVATVRNWPPARS
jgi:ketosteroid isomerase-like protein